MRFLTNFLCWMGWHKWTTKVHHVVFDGDVQPWFDGLYDIDDDSLVIGDIRCKWCDKQSEDTRDFLIL